MITREIAQASRRAKPLGEVAEFLDSRRKPVKQADRNPGPYPYYGANGQQGTIDGFIFDEPLVLLAEDGGFFDDPDRGIAYRIEGKTWVNNHAHVIKPKDGLDLSYLCRVLENYDVRPFINGSTRSKLTKTQASQIPIPFPPFDEQKRIAAILDQADALRRLRQQAIKVFEGMKTAVFHQMFSQSADKRPLGSIIKVGSGNGLTAKNMRGGNVPVYGGNGINGWHDEAFVDPETVIIGRVGVYCGAVHVTEQRAWVTDNALIVKKLVDIETDYLAEALKAANLNQYAGRSAQPLVSGSRIYPVEIPLPPIDDQQQFTSKAAAIAGKLAALHRSLDAMELLFGALQHRAFRGEL